MGLKTSDLVAAFKTTTDEQLKQIWMQRYILNFMQDPEVSYFEYRRNKYPVFPINPSTNLNLNNPNAIPVRWLYPTSETNYNRENLIEACDNCLAAHVNHFSHLLLCYSEDGAFNS